MIDELYEKKLNDLLESLKREGGTIKKLLKDSNVSEKELIEIFLYLLITKGYSFNKVANLLNLSEPTIRSYLKRHGYLKIKTNTPIDIPKETLIWLIFVEGLSYAEIIVKLGLKNVSLDRIQKYITKLGITKSKAPLLINSLKNPYNEKISLCHKNLFNPIMRMKVVVNINRHGKFSKTISTIYYIPEINKWVMSYSKLKSRLDNLGIDFDYWENRWFFKLEDEDIYTNLWIDRKVDFYYYNFPNHTKLFIKSKLSTERDYIFNGLMLKEDFIEQYNLSREKHNEKIYNYDFSRLPDIIKSATEPLTIVCNESISQSDEDYSSMIIGEFETNFYRFIIERKDCYGLKNLKSSITRTKPFENFLENARKVHGNRYDYSLSKETYVNRNSHIKIIDTLDNSCFIQTAIDHLSGRGNPSNRISHGEYFILRWISENLPNSNYLYDKKVESLATNIRIDFQLNHHNKVYWIEYNGEQHYKYVEFLHNGDLNNFKLQVDRDEFVREYCRLNSIILIEIPYTINTYSMISEILDKTINQGIDLNTLIDYNKLYK